MHWQNPLVYFKHALQFLLLAQTVVGYTQILFDDNIPIIVSPCLDKAGKIFGGSSGTTVDFISRAVTDISPAVTDISRAIMRGIGHLRAVTFVNARLRAVFSRTHNKGSLFHPGTELAKPLNCRNLCNFCTRKPNKYYIISVYKITQL